MRASKTKFIIKKSYYSRFVMGFFVFMGSLMVSGLVASVFAPVSDSSAQTISVENRATGYYVSVTSPASVSLDVSPTPAGSSVVSSASTVNVKTNAPAGYKLYLSTENDELVSLDASIAQTFSPVTSSALSANTWGYSLDSGTSKSWSAVPEVPSSSYHPESAIISAGADLISSSSTPNTPDGANVDVYYGVNADTSMPAGTYTTIVTYTAFAEGIPAAYTMQGFSVADCANMETDTTTVLTDIRNGNNYTIVKARDGNCWMADNLSIYNQTISSEDSNLPEGTSIALPTSTNWDTNDTTNLRLHVATNTGYEGEVYYSWCSAIGEENCGKYNVDGITINQSICPKGWRLPINGDANQNLSYAKLMNAYSVTNGAQLMDTSNPAYVLGFHKYYGHWKWNGNGEDGQGNGGLFWSSTAYSNTNAYYLYYSSATIDPQGTPGKGHGFTVRCVQENRTLSDVAYMQDMYDQICANSPLETSYTLTDKRDNNTYKVAKLKDGNCWMQSNLKLNGGRTITVNDSDVAANVTLPATDASSSNALNTMLIWAAKSGYDGNYYNWCASTASGDCSNIIAKQTSSICSRGWQLPNADGDHSFSNLFGYYGLPTTNTSTVAYVSTVEASPLYFSRGGRYGEGYWEQGSIGIYWTNLPNTDNAVGAYDFRYTSNTSAGYNFFDPKNSDWKGHGAQMRCVLR